jgi:uncharacterized membrane protein YgdD (TMEM256/DUF423 family)
MQTRVRQGKSECKLTLNVWDCLLLLGQGARTLLIADSWILNLKSSFFLQLPSNVFSEVLVGAISAMSLSALQEMPHFLWSTAVHYRVRKSPQLLPVLRQLNSSDTLIYCFFFILILFLHLFCPQSGFSFQFCVHLSSVICVLCVSEGN